MSFLGKNKQRQQQKHKDLKQCQKERLRTKIVYLQPREEIFKKEWDGPTAVFCRSLEGLRVCERAWDPKERIRLEWIFSHSENAHIHMASLHSSN